MSRTSLVAVRVTGVVDKIGGAAMWKDWLNITLGFWLAWTA